MLGLLNLCAFHSRPTANLRRQEKVTKALSGMTVLLCSHLLLLFCLFVCFSPLAQTWVTGSPLSELPLVGTLLVFGCRSQRKIRARPSFELMRLCLLPGQVTHLGALLARNMYAAFKTALLPDEAESRGSVGGLV